MAGGVNKDDPDNKVDNKDHVLMAFFKNQVAAIINNPWMKGVIILIFAAYLAGAFYGITTIKEGLERRKLSKEDSYSVKFFDLEDEYYREFPYRIQVSRRSISLYCPTAFFGINYRCATHRLCKCSLGVSKNFFANRMWVV